MSDQPIRELAGFLLPAIAEDEAAAAKLGQRAQQTRETLKEVRFLGRELPGWHDWPEVEATAARVLAKCAADRRMVLELSSWAATGSFSLTLCAYRGLRCLALSYADRPGYRAEWAL